MKTLKLKNRFQTNATLIANEFIDKYMVKANGEFVKVYLFLIRHMEDSDSSLTISMIADCLNHTENDILRAFRYWESEGLLALEKDADNRITGIVLEQALFLCSADSVPGTSGCHGSASTERADSATVKSAKRLSDSASDTRHAETQAPAAKKTIPLDSFKAQKELKSLLFIAEQYLGKTLTRTDVDAITYFYDTLGMSADLVEYLIESCVESGHKNIHYIQKVALSWADSGVTTVEQAKQRSAGYNKNGFLVMNAFGIKGRYPASSELVYIQRWSDEYGFSAEVIQEACRRTIASTHQPSFEYADTILKKWLQAGVKCLKDISGLDEAFQKERSSRKTPAASAKSTPKNMNNFERRTYDMDSLEEKLLNSN